LAIIYLGSLSPTSSCDLPNREATGNRLSGTSFRT